MRKVYFLTIIILTIILISAVGADLTFRQKKELGQDTLTIEKDRTNGLEVSIASISQTDNFYNIRAEYPQFKGVDPGFNKKISALMTEQIEAFKKNAKDNWEARRAAAPPDNPLPENPSAPFDFIAAWTPAQLNDRYLSFVINIYYFIGGAHGVTQFDAFNYDLIKNKEIAIVDFVGSSQALEKLSKLAVQAVTIQVQSTGLQIDDNVKQMIEQGTQPTEDNYKNFNFSYYFVTIYFQQYQVAPGYIGPLTITLYKDMLIDSSMTSDYLK